jgi:prepilin-type processing-associated H-X9-DG protein
VGHKPLWSYASDPSPFVNSSTVFNCPASRLLPGEIDPMTRVAFSYGINYKGTNNLGLAPGDPFKTTSVRSPSAFVVFADVRVNSAENPYYGSNPMSDLACPRGGLNHLSSRHEAGANLAFLDGHARWYKYDYMCV